MLDTDGFAIPTARSAALLERMSAVMPGGNTRTATWYPPYPVALRRGAGYELWDEDGNRYLDFVNNYTSLILGHAHPAVVAAVSAAAADGSAFPSPLACQSDHAERLAQRLPSVELVRYVNSGSEANMVAVRAARVLTGRDVIVKASVGYHGSWEQLPPTERGNDGIPDAVMSLVKMVRYNDVEALERLMEQIGDSVAAIILEPMLGAGVVRADVEYLAAARRLADRHGALLIFDEVVTFRVSEGGAQAVTGITPDLTTLGKIIGGGLPVGALGGRRELMEIFDPRRDGALAHHGTFNGNPCTLAAGAATLDAFRQPQIDRLNALSARFADGLSAQLAEHGVRGAVTRAGSLVQVHFDVDGPPRWGEQLKPGAPGLAVFHRAALERGVYIAPRGEFALSEPMTDAVVDEALAVLSEAMAVVAARTR